MMNTIFCNLINEGSVTIYMNDIVRGGMVQMEQAKVDRVKEWTRLRNVQEVHKFLSFMGYY